eukprot:9299350-Alexandrium_andersonii.AAC.1
MTVRRRACMPDSWACPRLCCVRACSSACFRPCSLACMRSPFGPPGEAASCPLRAKAVFGM